MERFRSPHATEMARSASFIAVRAAIFRSISEIFSAARLRTVPQFLTGELLSRNDAVEIRF
jgi:hypothetical protein